MKTAAAVTAAYSVSSLVSPSELTEAGGRGGERGRATEAWREAAW